jgi:hypothetical protein
MHLFIEAGEIFIQWLFEANMQGGSCLPRPFHHHRQIIVGHIGKTETV